MVSPPAAVPSPIVVDAVERRPPLKVSFVEVAFPGNIQSSVTAPFAYVSPPAKVVVAVHVGTPFERARTWPSVPAVVVASAPAPFPRTMLFAWMSPQPVPPFVTPSIPVMSLVRSMREVATTPAVALRKPVSEPMEKFDVKRFVLLAVVAKNEVVVALVPVAFTNVTFWSVEEPVVRRFDTAERLPALSIVVVAGPPK